MNQKSQPKFAYFKSDSSSGLGPFFKILEVESCNKIIGQ